MEHSLEVSPLEIVKTEINNVMAIKKLDFLSDIITFDITLFILLRYNINTQKIFYMWHLHLPPT